MQKLSQAIVERPGVDGPLPLIFSVGAELRDAQEAIIGYLLIGTDTTARKQTEEERMKLDQRLRDRHFDTRSLIESSIDALITTDPRGIITDINKQTEALTGRTRDKLVGAPFTKPVNRAALCLRARNLIRLKVHGDDYRRLSEQLTRELASRNAQLAEQTRVLEQQAVVIADQAALLAPGQPAAQRIDSAGSALAELT
jgi:PAS domain-containing protein